MESILSFDEKTFELAKEPTFTVADDYVISETTTSNHSVSKPGDKTIRPDLEKFGFSSDIIEKAVELFTKSAIGTRRGRKRRQILFYYVLAAYNTFNIPVDPKALAKKCKLKNRQISNAMSQCTAKAPEVPNIVIWTPYDYIQTCYNIVAQRTDLCIQFPEGAVQQIQDMTREILRNDPNLLNPKPQNVAAAIVLYYLNINGINVNREDYSLLFGNSAMTFTKLYKEVSAAYNK